MALTFKASNKEAGDYVVLEPDTYRAAYTHYEEFNGGQYGPALKLFFDVQDEDNNRTVEVSGIAGIPASGNLNVKSKLRDWIEGMLGRKLEDGEDIDMASLVNTGCRLVLDVVTKPRQDGTESTFNKIVKVLPVKRGRPAGPF